MDPSARVVALLRQYSPRDPITNGAGAGVVGAKSYRHCVFP